MAKYSIIQQGDTAEYSVMSVVVNTAADVATLPVNWTSGSTAFVIEDSSVYMLSLENSVTNKKEWKKV